MQKFYAFSREVRVNVGEKKKKRISNYDGWK